MINKDCPQYYECTSGECDKCNVASVYADLTPEHVSEVLYEIERYGGLMMSEKYLKPIKLAAESYRREHGIVNG